MNSMRRVEANENIKGMSEKEYVASRARSMGHKRTYQSEETRRVCEAVDKVYHGRVSTEKDTT